MLSKKDRYNMVTSILQQRRFDKTQKESQRLLEVSSICPEIKELRMSLSRTSLKLAKAILKDGESSAINIEKIQNENLSTQQKIQSLLKSKGFPIDYLDPSPICNKCDDYGRTKDGICECMKKLMNQIAAEDLQKSSHLKLFSFADFNLELFSKEVDNKYGVSPFDQMSNVYRFCVDYANTFSPNYKGIIMTGKTGLGKTHLSLSIANVIIQKGYSVVYSTTSEIIQKMSDKYFGRGDSSNLTETLFEADLLILDDLGAEFETSFSTSALYDVIANRISSQKPTIVNTNLTPLEIQKRYSDRIVSRLFASLTQLQFMGTDIRTILSNKRK